MAILQRVALYPAERFDTPDARAMEAYVQNDFKYLITGMLTDKSLILSGFEITNYIDLFNSSAVKIRQNNVSFLHPESTSQATGFYVSAGTEPDFQTNLNPGATNFVELDLGATSGTPDVRAFWDAGANGGAGAEYTDTVDTVININISITTNVTGFTTHRIPLYKILTDLTTGKVTNLTDCRPLFFRLGTGGTSPDPTNNFAYPNTPDASHARMETPVSATSATAFNSPFQGGDKNIKNIKQMFDAIMSSFKEIKATPFWYMAPQASLATSFQNAALTLVVGGTWVHLGKSAKVTTHTTSTVSVQAGTLFDAGPSAFRINGNAYTYTTYNPSTSIFTGVTPDPSTDAVAGRYLDQGSFGHLKLQDGSTVVRLGQANSTLQAFADIDLTALPALYVLLSRDGTSLNYMMGQDGSTPIKPKLISAVTNNSFTVPTGGNYKTSAATILVHGAEFSYTSYTPGTGLFTGISPDPMALVSVADMAYQIGSAGSAYYHQSSSAQVPGTQNGASMGVERVLWLAYYDGVSTIFLHDAQLVPGQSASVGSADSNEIYNYVGSSGPADGFPVYNVGSVTNGTDLTDALTTAFHIIEKPIYDEFIYAPAGSFAPGDYITLPPNTRASNASGQYSLGTGELVIYEEGILLAPALDYIEASSTQIQIQRAVMAGQKLRFRIANIGGAGAAAGGGSSGVTLQGAYANGGTISVTPGNPVVIAGPAGQKLLHVVGNVQIDGILDPTAVQLSPQVTNPLPAGQTGIWYQMDPSTGGTSHKFMSTNADGTTVAVQAILEQVGGNTQYFSRSKTNNTGATIPAGSAVTILSDGSIDLCDSVDVSRCQFFGVTKTSIPSGSAGPVIYSGVVSGIFAGMGLQSGSYVYLGPAPGSISPSSGGSSQSLVNIILGIVDGNDLILQVHVEGRTA